MDEFEKRLTAVHTRGLENVESPEMEEENQREGGSTVLRTPLPTKGRPKSKRGELTFIRLCCMEMHLNGFSFVFSISLWAK